jgi:hypothetical protein
LADNFRTIIGVVQFPPKEGSAGGKAVRNITVRQTGFKEQSVRVSATLWPSFDGVSVEEGDVVVLEGKYAQNKGSDSDGNPRTYHNLSVTGIAVLGQIDKGQKVDVENSYSEPETDDEIPF